MQYDKQRGERQFLKLFIIFVAALTGYLFFHTLQWDPEEPFLTTEPLVPWWIFATGWGLLVGSFAWDQSYIGFKVTSLWKQFGYMLGFLAYFLIVLLFNILLFHGMLFSLDGLMSRIYPTVGIDPVAIHPYITPEVNRFLLPFYFIAVTVIETLSIGKPLARWFNTSMESWLDLEKPPTPPEKPDNPPSQEPKEEHTATLEAFKTLDFDIWLPGHGPVMRSREPIDNFQDYLADLWDSTVEMYENDVPADDAAEQIDMSAHAANFPQIQGPGVDPRAINRIYQLLDER